MKVKSKRGSYIVEASIVLPVIVFATLTAVLVIMFFFSQMTERSRIHMALRNEAGMMTEKTVYLNAVEQMQHADVEIYKNKKAVGGELHAKKYLIMLHKGLLDQKGTFTVEGSCHAVDGPEYIRYCDFVKGIGETDNEQ